MHDRASRRSLAPDHQRHIVGHLLLSSAVIGVGPATKTPSAYLPPTAGEPTSAARSYGHRRRLRRSRPMSPKDGTYLAHRQGTPLLGLLPREDAHFGLQREHRGRDGDGIRMRRDFSRQDQYGGSR